MVRQMLANAGILCLIGVAIGAGREPEPADAKGDAIVVEQKRFEGTWAFESMIVDGNAVPEAQFKASRMTFKDDRFVVNDKAGIKGFYKVDPTAKPKTIDVTLELPGGKRLTHGGIYTLEGDTYTICTAGKGRPRPTELASKPGDRRRAPGPQASQTLNTPSDNR